jgi:hypothetical protein
MAYCRQCGKEVRESEAFCRHCGAKAGMAAAASGAFGGGASASDDDLAAFIGKNADKYLAKFRLFRQGSTDSFAATWHWPAFLFTFWWSLYRKMYGWAALVLFLGCIPYVGFLSMIAFGVSGNYLYYKHAGKKMLELGAQPLSPVERTAALARSGGVNNIVVVVLPLLLIALIGIVAAIAIPQYHVYRQKAYDVQAKHEIQEACSLGLSVFASHPERMEITPEDILDAGLARTTDVDLVLLDGRKAFFGLSAKHAKGKKLYTTDKNCALNEEEQAQGNVI